MFYKVVKEGKVIDVLDHLVFLRYNPRHNIMVLCSESEAQAILSSDKNNIWHESSLYRIPVPGYDTVTLEEIDEYEYRQLKILNCRTPQEIVDTLILELINDGVL